MKTSFDIQLSEHFKLSEFVQTDYADFQLLNTVQYYNIRTLVDDLLEPLRRKFNKPIKINSGFRGERVNEKVGGVKNSLHRLGLASDISSDYITPTELYNALTEIILSSSYQDDEIELIKYPTFVHIGIDINKFSKYI